MPLKYGFKKPDPRIALVSAFVYSAVTAILTEPLAALFALFPPFILLFMEGRTVEIIARFRGAILFILMLALIVPFTTPGPDLLEIGFLSISWPGVKLALLICLKCLALLAAFGCLLAPLSSTELAAALYWFHCPRQLTAMFLLMDMNLHIIKNEWQKLKTAAMLRGFKARTNMHSYRTLASMLALLLGRAALRAKRSHEGMLLRGFNGHFPVSKLAPFTRDALTLPGMSLFCSFLLLTLNYSISGQI